MSNTIIQLKRSANTEVAPNGSLAAGQPGYSFLSGRFFVGNTDGTGIETVGGSYYTAIIDASSSANTANSLVQRTPQGDFTARHITATQVIGNAASANALSPGAYIASGGEITGNVIFDGTTNINLALVLDVTGVTAATYGAGDGSQIPVILVDSKGRITSASNVATPAGSSFTVSGNVGTDTTAAGDTLNLYGNGDLTITVSANTGNTVVSIDLDDSGVTAATYGAGDGSQIPVILIDSKGRITSASNVATPAGSSFGFTGNSGTDTATAGDTLNFYGGDGMSSTILANTGNTIVVMAVDSTVVRTTGDQSIAGLKTFTGDMAINANLTVTGTTTYVNTTQLDVGDNMVVLNADLPIASTPTEDAGIEINRGDQNGNSSIYWDETNDWWTAVSNVLVSGASALGRIHTDSYSNATAMSTGVIPIGRFTGAASPAEGQILQVAANGAQIWGFIDGGLF